MPKKSPAKKAVKKASPAKKVAVKKAAAKSTKAAKPAGKSGAKPKSKQAATSDAKKPSPVSSTAAAPKPEISLGRPLVTQEEKLFMLFHDDYQARQLFEFLRVDTVKELEQFSQQQIVHIMSKPVRMTIDRIRQRLAQYKRSLKDDEQFASEFRKQSEKN